MSWIQTYTGLRVNPSDLLPDDLNLYDIAHALSNKCRYSGHSKWFYSVAEHSVLLTRCFPHFHKAEKRWALLHDADEAYLPDIARPLAPLFPEISALKEKIHWAVSVKWHLEPEIPASVKQLDDQIIALEAPLLMGNVDGWQHRDWHIPNVCVECWGPVRAELELLRCATELGLD